MVSKAISYHKIPLKSLSNNSCRFGSEIPTTFVQPQVKVIDPEFAIFGPPGLDAWWAQGGWRKSVDHLGWTNWTWTWGELGTSVVYIVWFGFKPWPRFFLWFSKIWTNKMYNMKKWTWDAPKKTWGGSVVFLGLGTPNFGNIRQWLLFKSGKNCDVYVGQGALELSNNHGGQAKSTASQKENTVQNILAWRWFLELVGKRLWETEDS